MNTLRSATIYKFIKLYVLQQLICIIYFSLLFLFNSLISIMAKIIIISSRLLLIIATEVCPSNSTYVVKRPIPKVLATINEEESYA